MPLSYNAIYDRANMLKWRYEISSNIICMRIYTKSSNACSYVFIICTHLQLYKRRATCELKLIYYKAYEMRILKNYDALGGKSNC